jgi:SUMO ligase MMS21 Smc5/6 complex component
MKTKDKPDIKTAIKNIDTTLVLATLQSLADVFEDKISFTFDVYKKGTNTNIQLFLHHAGKVQHFADAIAEQKDIEVAIYKIVTQHTEQLK